MVLFYGKMMTNDKNFTRFHLAIEPKKWYCKIMKLLNTKDTKNYKKLITVLIALSVLLNSIPVIKSTTQSLSETIREEINLTLQEAKLAALSIPKDKLYEKTYTFTSEEKIPKFKIDALAIEWEALIPEGTTLNISVRFFEEGKWGSWQHVENDTDIKSESELEKPHDLIIANRAAKFQYQVYLSTNDTSKTPVLKNIEFTYVFSPSLPGEEGIFDPLKIDFDRILAGLKIVSDSNPRVISRSEWGADESLRYENGSFKEETVVDVSGEIPSNGEANEDDFYKEYKDEIALEKILKTDAQGKKYKWPVEIAAKLRKFIIHHTATSKDLDNPKAAIRSIYYYHAISRGWGDIGYNYIIDQQGKIYEGRFGGEKVVGAHAGRANTGSIGIAVLGNYENEDVPYPVIQSLINLISEKANLYDIDPLGRSSFRGERLPNILGHGDVMDTSCPGAKLYAKLPDLRKLIAQSLVENGSVLESTETQSTAEFDFEETGDRSPLIVKAYSNGTFTIKLKNTGTAVWTNETFLVANQHPENQNMITFNANEEKSSNIASLKEASVAPGETGTFEGKVHSFLRAGLITFDITPIFNGKKKIEKYILLPLYVNKPKLSYAVYEIHLPKTNLKGGEKTSTWVKLQNTGDVPWTNAGPNPMRLGADGPRDRLSPMANNQTRLASLKQEKVNPGEIGYFEMEFVAPKTGGVYREHFTPVIEGISWLKEEKSLEFVFFVEGSTYKAEFVSASEENILKPGETKKVWLKMRNIGDARWVRKGVNAVQTNVVAGKGITVAGVKLDRDVEPKNIGKLEFQLTAPEKEGTYRVYFWPRVKNRIISKKPLKFYFKVMKEIPNQSKGDTIRVALSVSGDPVIRGDGKFDIMVNSEKIESYDMDDAIEVSLKDGQYTLKNGNEAMVLADYPRFVPNEGTILRIDNFTNRPSWSTNVNDNQYRGILEVRDVEENPMVVNELPLEDYLKGVAEPAESDPYEKIKTLAILARTYAKFYLDVDKKFPSKPYDASDDPGIFQRYLGYGYELRAPNMTRAVNETQGMVVTYQGSLVKTPYFSSSDGRTRSAQEVFGWTNTPYLQSVADPYCEGMELRGHGVGLSGCGAYGAAKDGKTAEEIIKYYYQGVEIEKLY